MKFASTLPMVFAVIYMTLPSSSADEKEAVKATKVVASSSAQQAPKGGLQLDVSVTYFCLIHSIDSIIINF